MADIIPGESPTALCSQSQTNAKPKNPSRRFCSLQNSNQKNNTYKLSINAATFRRSCCKDGN